MRPDIYWIPIPNHQLAIMPRPRSGEWLEEEVRAWKLAGIDTVVSLLEPDEIRGLGLFEQAALCKHYGIAFLSFPIPDRGTPSNMASTQTLINGLVERLVSGKPIAIHCRAGIGRSSLIAACILYKLGISDEFQLVSKARGVAVPDTELQIQWLAHFKDG